MKRHLTLASSTESQTPFRVRLNGLASAVVLVDEVLDGLDGRPLDGADELLLECVAAHLQLIRDRIERLLDVRSERDLRRAA
jgi:hypothetical protein